MAGGALVPRPVRRLWASLFHAPELHTHGTAHFGTARNAARHLAPPRPKMRSCWAFCATHRAAPIAGSPGWPCADLRPDRCRQRHRRRHPQPARIPRLGLRAGLQGEIHAVTASARRALGHDVILIDPFGVAGARREASTGWIRSIPPIRCDQPRRRTGRHAGDRRWRDRRLALERHGA